MRPHEIDDLVHRAAGNPLFLGELIAMTRSGAAAASLPESVEGLLTVEIDNLPPVPRRLLRFAAVLGRSFERALLEDVVGERVDDDEHARRPRPPSRGRRRRPAPLPARARPRRRLRGALLQAAARAAHPRRRGDRAPGRRPARRARRAPVAPLLRGRPSRRRVALRARRGGARQRRLRERRSRGALRTRPLVGTAGRCGAGGARHRRRVARRRAGADRRLPGGGHLVPAGPAAAARGRARAGPHDREGGTRRRAPGPLLDVGALDPQGSAAPRRRTRRRRVERPGPARRDVRGDPPGPGRAPRVPEVVREGDRRGRPTAKDRDALAHAYRILDWAWMDLGRADRATHSTDALAIYEELGDLTGQATAANNLGVAAYYTGDWERAIEWYERGRDLLAQTGNAVDAAFGTSNVAEILANQGRLDEAEPLFVDALRIWQAAGYRGGVGFATMHLGRIAARRGENARAVELLARARADFEAIEASTDVLEADVVAPRPRSSPATRARARALGRRPGTRSRDRRFGRPRLGPAATPGGGQPVARPGRRRAPRARARARRGARQRRRLRDRAHARRPRTRPPDAGPPARGPARPWSRARSSSASVYRGRVDAARHPDWVTGRRTRLAYRWTRGSLAPSATYTIAWPCRFIHRKYSHGDSVG